MVGEAVGVEEKLLLILFSQEVRRGMVFPSLPSFSELERLSRPGRLVVRVPAAVGVLGCAAVVSFTGSSGVGVVTARGKYEERAPSEVACCSGLRGAGGWWPFCCSRGGAGVFGVEEGAGVALRASAVAAGACVDQLGAQGAALGSLTDLWAIFADDVTSSRRRRECPPCWQRRPTRKRGHRM